VIKETAKARECAITAVETQHIRVPAHQRLGVQFRKGRIADNYHLRAAVEQALKVGEDDAVRSMALYYAAWGEWALAHSHLQAGDLDGASQMLGRAYSLAGTVVRGARLGTGLGFPTANLETTGLALPPNGVYAVHARFDGQTHRGVLNLGFRPTLKDANPQLRLEVHLLDFQGDLYDQELEVIFVDKLRDEKKFASLAELRAQIARDTLDAQSRFWPGRGS